MNQLTTQQVTQLAALANLLTALGGECTLFFNKDGYGITIENYDDSCSNPVDLFLLYSTGKLVTES